MRRLLLYVFLLALVSCTHTKQINGIVIEDNIVKPTAYQIQIKGLLEIGEFAVYDSSLILINRRNDSALYVYDALDFSYKGSIGIRGNGPNDFLYPFFLRKEVKEKDIVPMFDVNAASFKYININKALDNKEGAIISHAMPPKLIGSPNFIQVGSCFWGNIDVKNRHYFIYDSHKDEMRWVVCQGPLLDPNDEFATINMNRIALNFQTHHVVSAMSYYNLLFLYDEDANRIKTVQVGDELIVPKFKGKSEITEETLDCFDVIASTQDKVYVLGQKGKIKDYGNTDNPPSRILVFDWELNYLQTYQLPHYCLNFYVDEQHHRILYSLQNEEGDTELYYFPL